MRVNHPSVLELEVIRINRRAVNLAFAVTLAFAQDHAKVLAYELPLEEGLVGE